MNQSTAPRGQPPGWSRRGILRATGVGLPVLLAATWSAAGSRAAAAQEKVIVRTTSGGSYGDAMDKAIFEPFTRATGIAVERTPVGMAPLAASVKQGHPLVDVVDTSEGLLQTLADDDVLEPLDYGRFKQFAIADIGNESAQRYLVRRMVYARVLAYNKSAFAKTPAPTSWQEFWNVRKFPAARALPGLGLDYPDLEFALLADGVPMAALYPLNIARALAAYARIRPDVHTFYPTDAISASLLSTNEVDLEPIANGRIQPLIDQGGDYAIVWNQHMKVPSGYSILRGAQNLENAYKLIEFAMAPEAQAAFSTQIPYGPINAKAFRLIPESYADKLPTNPKWTQLGFTQDAAWWGKNVPEVTKAWNEWAAR